MNKKDYFKRAQYWDKDTLQKLYHEEHKTLAEIGVIYGVSRQRVFQVMQRDTITRLHKRSRRKYHNRYKSLEDYLAHTHVDNNEIGASVRRYLPKNLHCQECGSKAHIHIHHINYPATSLNDIQILCASCHSAKHRKGMTYTRKLDLYNLRAKGFSLIQLAKMFNISKGRVSHICTSLDNNK